MQFTQTKLKAHHWLRRSDHRGFLLTLLWRECKPWLKQTVINVTCLSTTKKDWGMHYQMPQPETKLVRCTQQLLCVIIDMRPKSPPPITHWCGTDWWKPSSSVRTRDVCPWLPALTDGAEVLYQVSVLLQATSVVCAITTRSDIGGLYLSVKFRRKDAAAFVWICLFWSLIMIIG